MIKRKLFVYLVVVLFLLSLLPVKTNANMLSKQLNNSGESHASIIESRNLQSSLSVAGIVADVVDGNINENSLAQIQVKRTKAASGIVKDVLTLDSNTTR
ncbi:hypothetical protein [Bacillus massiliigorillae]|uniref:hypothetical protein n=1 Tax=Bacillus massiliigorillae TaxID=1243664 RepID=UPI0003A2B023|nr:hypothetical protein [Bacillus massiliigorillae]